MLKEIKKIEHSRWLKEQKERKIKTKIKVLKIIFIFLAIFLSGFLFFGFWQWYKGSLWDGKHNFNLVVWAGNHFYLISYRSGLDEVNLLRVAPATYIPLAKGFGEYPVSSIWALGDLEKFGGGQLLQFSAQSFLGIPVQAWGRIKSKIDPEGKVSKKDLNKIFWDLFFSSERNFNRLDLTRLFLKVKFLPSQRFHFYTLDKTQAAEEVILPDGRQAFKVQKDFLDKLVADIYRDSAVVEEGIMWSIVNKTGKKEVVFDVVRLLANIGGEVVAIEEQKDTFFTGGIYCSQPKICQSYTAKLLSQSLHLPIKKEKLDEERAEGVILLDENFWQEFYQR